MADSLLVLTCKLLCLFCALGGVYQRSNENNSEDGEENYQTGPCWNISHLIMKMHEYIL